MFSCGMTEQYSENLKYTPAQDRSTCTLTGFGDCTDERIVIPPKNKQNKVVTGISIEYAYKNVKEIILPDTVVTLNFRPQTFPNLIYNEYEGGYYLGTAKNPYYAFIYYDPNASTDTIIHPDTILIADKAFEGHATQKSAIITNGVKYVGSSAFSDCNALTEISIPPSIIRMETQVFAKCDSLESVTIPATLNEVPEELFLACRSLKNIAIEDGITLICKNAFNECISLEEITIPASVDTISFSAFEDCTSLKNVTLNEGLKSINSGAFENCKSLTKINIPLSVEKICIEVFNGCENLNFSKHSNGLYLGSADNPYAVFIKVVNTDITDIELHQDTKIIADCAFNTCKKLTKIAIPNGVTRFGDDLFTECESLTKVTLPSSLKTIAPQTFYKCTQLKQIDFNGTTEEWKAMSDRQQGWASGSAITKVQCADGVIQLNTYDKQMP